MIIADDNGNHRLVNDDMIMAIARAIKWNQEIRTGVSPRQIAKREDLVRDMFRGSCAGISGAGYRSGHL